MTNDLFRANLGRHRGGEALRTYASLVEPTVLRLLVRGEAEGESDLGQSAVAWVVLNRVRSATWWGSTILQVALWPQQFSCFWSDFATRHASLDDELRTPTPRIVRNIETARKCYAHDLDGDDPTKGATYYWNPAVVTPTWSPRVTIVATIGHHVFAVDAPPKIVVVEEAKFVSSKTVTVVEDVISTAPTTTTPEEEKEVVPS